MIDWFGTLNPFNIAPIVAMMAHNLDLYVYLFKVVIPPSHPLPCPRLPPHPQSHPSALTRSPPDSLPPRLSTSTFSVLQELAATKEGQLATLREFVPDAKPEDWTIVWAGQRVQIVKPDKELVGKLQFGTEVVASKDKTIVGLLGASPGASVSPHIAIEVLSNFESEFGERCRWHAMLAQMIPSYGRDVNKEKGLYAGILARANEFLLTGKSSGFRSSKVTIGRSFDNIDVDKNGEISMREMRRCAQNCPVPQLAPRTIHARTSEVRVVACMRMPHAPSRRLVVLAYVVGRYLKKQGMDAKSIAALIKKLDANGDGRISRDEFVAGFGDFVTGTIELPAKPKKRRGWFSWLRLW